MSAQALIFTHIAIREQDGFEPRDFENFVKQRRPFFQACVRCSNIGIVFIYSSYGVERFIKSLKAGATPQLPLEVLQNEQYVFDAINKTIDQATKAEQPKGSPKFVVIGIRELASHLLRLQRSDPELVLSLARLDGAFTYDSPKYVEAILRLARGQGHLPNDPIVRIDIDVEVNEQSLDAIIAEAERCANDFTLRSMWWFSGSYFGNGPDDPVNVHAVRQHWLVSRKPGRENEYELPRKARSFLADIAEVGATQLLPGEAPLSAAAREIVAKRGKKSKNRRKPQVISGAGLVASAAAIRRLPPFMNAPEMVVWIDDHLKRRLHEVIGDIDAAAPERIDAPMKQDRFPQGIKVDEKGTRDYFRRLLNGCLFDAAIEVPLFASAVGAIVHNRPRVDAARVRKAIAAAVETRYAEVMHIWRNADYGRNLLRNWARQLKLKDKTSFCNGTVAACLDYLKLCELWPKHVQAIQDLLPNDAYWLFTESRREAPAVRSAATDAMVEATTAMAEATRAMTAATDAMLRIRGTSSTPRIPVRDGDDIGEVRPSSAE